MKNVVIKFAGCSGQAITYLVSDENKESQFVGCHLGEIAISTNADRVGYKELANEILDLIVVENKIIQAKTKDTIYTLHVPTSTFEEESAKLNAESLLKSFSKVEGTKKDKPVPAPVHSTPAKKGKRTKSAINDSELVVMLETIKANFAAGVKFQNKDFAPLVADTLSARQTPSRLKKLVDAGSLQSDDAKPKNYWY